MVTTMPTEEDARALEAVLMQRLAEIRAVSDFTEEQWKEIDQEQQDFLANWGDANFGEAMMERCCIGASPNGVLIAFNLKPRNGPECRMTIPLDNITDVYRALNIATSMAIRRVLQRLHTLHDDRPN